MASLDIAHLAEDIGYDGIRLVFGQLMVEVTGINFGLKVLVLHAEEIRR
jgi:hypothetical protein